MLLDEIKFENPACLDEEIETLENILRVLRKRTEENPEFGFSDCTERLRELFVRCGYDLSYGEFERMPLSNEQLATLHVPIAATFKEIFKCIHSIARQMDCESTNLRYLKAQGRIDEIRQYIEIKRHQTGFADSDTLSDYALSFGTDAQIDAAIQDIHNWAVDPDAFRLWECNWSASLGGRLLSGSPTRELMRSITDTVNHCLTGTQLRRFSKLPLLDINAAVELQKKDFDLVVGVAQGGIAIPFCMEIMGQNTVYLRPSRRTDVVTRLQSISKPGPIASGGSILICEDDAVTGKTLERIMPLIDRLNPARVEMCFSGYNPEVSFETIAYESDSDSRIDYYSVPMELSVVNFMQKVRMFKAKTEEVARRGFATCV